MTKALYRKYRSKKFSEVIGQEHITSTLQKAIKGGRVSHAYLFTGPRGVGKTSVARILAHEVNNLAYDSDTVHIDIIEIDAASNRRIDEIRDLREKVHIMPVQAKYKVYIIDEVHMLTREAFNALLKTLEEPPAHCIFILATTEVHKLPETIVSRTQRFSFKPIQLQQAVGYLSSIAKKENITISNEALSLIAEHGNGSFRDSISFLDQLSSHGGRITEAEVRDLLGLPPTSLIAKVIDALNEANSQRLIGLVEELRLAGASPAIIAKEVASKIRQQIIGGDHSGRLLKLLKNLVEVPSSTDEQTALELSLLEACSEPDSTKNIKAAELNNHRKTSNLAISRPAKISEVNLKQPFSLEDDWHELLLSVKAEAPSLYTALRLAEPKLLGNKLSLIFKFPLHKNKVNQPPNRRLIETVIASNYRQNIEIECAIDKSTKNLSVASKEAETTISNIFGGAEVLES